MLALWLTSFLIHLAEIFGYKVVAFRQPTDLTFPTDSTSAAFMPITPVDEDSIISIRA